MTGTGSTSPRRPAMSLRRCGLPRGVRRDELQGASGFGDLAGGLPRRPDPGPGRITGHGRSPSSVAVRVLLPAELPWHPAVIRYAPDVIRPTALPGFQPPQPDEATARACAGARLSRGRRAVGSRAITPTLSLPHTPHPARLAGCVWVPSCGRHREGANCVASQAPLILASPPPRRRSRFAPRGLPHHHVAVVLAFVPLGARIGCRLPAFATARVRRGPPPRIHRDVSPNRSSTGARYRLGYSILTGVPTRTRR